MLVAFDSSFLVMLLDPTIREGRRPDARVEYLLENLTKSRAKIVIPTPALSEVLIGAGDAAAQYLDIISKSARFKVVPFGERAAVEAAAAHREAIDAGDKKEGTANWNKVKFDRQIVSIAKVEGAQTIYSNDSDVVRLGAKAAIDVLTLNDLEYPPHATQGTFSFDQNAE